MCFYCKRFGHKEWAEQNVRSSTSVLVKRLKAYLPEEDSINEGSEM